MLHGQLAGPACRLGARDPRHPASVRHLLPREDQGEVFYARLSVLSVLSERQLFTPKYFFACFSQLFASCIAARCTMVEDCAALAEMRCVFILALGRTGSTHLLRLLNSIEGYRISGETDNAWIHMGWFMESIRAGSSHGHHPVGLKRRSAVLPASAENATLCDMRRLMLDVHNPSPRARCAAAIRPIFCCSGQRHGLSTTASSCLSPRRVFGFKEIYSPFVRRPLLLDEVFSQVWQPLPPVTTPNLQCVWHHHLRAPTSSLTCAGHWQRAEAVPTRQVHLPLA